MRHCPNVAIDVHIYQAWAWKNDAAFFQQCACDGDFRVGKQLEAAGVAVVVGEWSLATDNCAMWLNGRCRCGWGWGWENMKRY